VTGAWRRVHPLARLALLGLAIVCGFAAIALTGPLSGDRVDGWIGGGAGSGSGVAVAAAFVGLYAGLTALAFPGPVLAGASGLLFGTWEGAGLALCGAVLGAGIAFLLARGAAGDVIAATGGPRLRRVAEWIGRRGFRSVLYARIMPGLPYSAVNYAAGLTPVRLRAFIAATALGAAPRTYAYAALGGHIDDLTSPAALIAGGVIVGMALLGVGLALRARAHSDVPSLRRLLRGTAAARTRDRDHSEHLNLQQARRPGPPARQPGGDTDAVAGLAPAELEHAAGAVGDQLLGDVVAAQRGGLHAPHQPTPADGLAAGGEGVDRRLGSVGRDEPGRAA
jgi:uncharacterized membrane protein YdjX (TVP38/TMEM64 family)